MANGRPEQKKSNLWKWLLGCGCLILLAGGIVVGGGIWYGMKSFTLDPVKAKKVADSIVKFDVPEGHVMIFASEPPFIGWKMAAFGNQKQNPTTMGMMMLFPKSMNVNQAQMEAQMNQQAQKGAGGKQMTVASTTEDEITVAGQTTKLIEKILVDQNSGGKMRQYTFMLDRPNGMVMIIFQSPADDFDEVSWESFVTSIQ